MRILIVTHAPLSPEFGAGQMAINLAEAFRGQGHDVTLWSPHPLPPQTKWWQRFQKMRWKLDEYIQTQQPFDLIDVPAFLITKRLGQSALVVARSVQPDLLYLAYKFNNEAEISFKSIVNLIAGILHSFYQAFLVLQGWSRSRYILCLGSLEFYWMKKWFPWWRNKLISYVNALSKSDQEALSKVRLNRQQPSGDSIRFLWIGRWASHKGTDILLNFIEEWTYSRPQDTFTIAGCGTEAEKACSSELLQSGRVKVLPSFERSQLHSLLANHDVGLFTSKVEGWGLVLNEMLESGMPIFATSVGGVPDLQPFLEKMIIPFPALLQSITNIPLKPVNLENYYKTFTWEKIAENYTRSILIKSDSYLLKIEEN